MKCDCQSELFDCEDKVRRFLRASGENSSDGRVALDELIEKVTPLVERTANLKLQGNPWRQRRGDAIQNTLVKLCTPEKLATWWENPRRSWFCHWAYVVAYHCAIDAIHDTSSSQEPSDIEANPTVTVDVREQAKRLREAINTTLVEFDLEWRLVFCMKFSYVAPDISTIAREAKIAKETVFFRLRKMKERIAERCDALLSPEVLKIVLVGVRHPVEEFERLEKKAERDRVNSRINELLGAHPMEEQFAFYAKYSPLSPSIDSIANQLGQDRNIVGRWLEQIETQIRRPH